jgi:hypothetical protein
MVRDKKSPSFGSVMGTSSDKKSASVERPCGKLAMRMRRLRSGYEDSTLQLFKLRRAAHQIRLDKGHASFRQPPLGRLPTHARAAATA